MDINESINIQESLKIMLSIAHKLMIYTEAFQKKGNDIFQQFKTKRLSTDEKNYTNFIDSLAVKSEELKSLCNEIESFMVNSTELILEKTSLQYRSFLLNEIINYNWSQMNYMDDYFIRVVTIFLGKLEDKPVILTTDDHSAIDALYTMTTYLYLQHLIILQNKISSIKIFDKIKDIKDNVVMIGANGSGKSTFARSLQGKLSTNTTILSAQHLLVYIKPETISTNNKEIYLVHDFQSRNKLGSDPDLMNLFSNDFKNLISALFIENGDREHNYFINIEDKQEPILVKAIRIWAEIIGHRKLIYSRHCLEVSTLDGVNKYDFNFLSDGEKAVFYYISHVLLAKQNNYIIVDEPESHLHLAICNRLWDILERERKDCKFIYLTHNLDFATTRNNRVLLWNRNFIPPSEWDVIILKADDDIPERLLIEIVGSRKNILFCEGDNKTSLDFKLYSILFGEYTIIPVGGHLNVVNYCMAYNRNKTTYGQEAIGIIDGDCHQAEQIDKWKNNKIYTLPINEIENLLCDEIILISAAKRFCSEYSVIELFKTNFFDELEKDKERQAVWYANNIINNNLKDNMLKEKSNLNSLKKEIQEVINEEIVQANYDMRLKELNECISSKDFERAMKICNFKNKLIGYMANVIVNNYKDRIFKHISNDSDLIDKIRIKYFSFMS